ncbi:hypothetical protein OSTOST_20891 [Ostertagia ostertagi]
MFLRQKLRVVVVVREEHFCITHASMFNRTKSKDFRVEVLLPSPRQKGRINFRKDLELLEDDVVVVDNSMKPSTSERSVELARHEPSSSTSSAENKRNRLYAPLSALSSRLHINQPEQFRNTHSEEVK